MTTLATGLAIDYSSASKITPALRLSVQKATSAFQKDFCYDFLQALVDEPEIADPVGIRVFLNFCLRKPDTLIDSFLDTIDQNVGASDNFEQDSETILDEVENFIEFVHGLIEMIDSGEVFKLAYHEIDAWKLCYKLLEPMQRRLFDLAIQDRQRVLAKKQQDQDDPAKNNLAEREEPELTFASETTNSGFYQAFVNIDKFLKHAFESRALLEPAKLVEDLDQLNERKAELETFRTVFPPLSTSTVIQKKWGRFGREEAAIDQFINSDKFKELSKLKSTMSGGQLTRQPSTRTRKKTGTLMTVEKNPTTDKNNHSNGAPTTNSRRSQSNTSGSNQVQTDAPQVIENLIDPFFNEDPPSPPRKLAFAIPTSVSDSDIEDEPIYRRRRSHQPHKASAGSDLTSKKLTNRSSLPTQSTTNHTKRKRSKLNEEINEPRLKTSAKKKKKVGGKSIEDEQEELFEVERIIAETVDEDGNVLYHVLWAGYPESEATWQPANTLDDCAAVDVWQEQKQANGAVPQQSDREPPRSPAALAS